MHLSLYSFAGYTGYTGPPAQHPNNTAGSSPVNYQPNQVAPQSTNSQQQHTPTYVPQPGPGHVYNHASGGHAPQFQQQYVQPATSTYPTYTQHQTPSAKEKFAMATSYQHSVVAGMTSGQIGPVRFRVNNLMFSS